MQWNRNLNVVDGQRLAGNRYGVVDMTRTIQDVGKIQQRHVAVLLGNKVQRTAYTLDTVWTVADDAPVQSCKVVQHPTWTDFLQTCVQPTDNKNNVRLTAANLRCGAT